MKISEAVARRRSIRAFLPQPIEHAVVERILDRARRAPSGGNLQPWHVVAMTGEPLKALFAAVEAWRAAPTSRDNYHSYPDPLPDPWMDRRRRCATDLSQSAGIAREDRVGRVALTARNFIGFGAPCIVFCHVPRLMGPAQWADLGIWLQTVMLLIEEEGLASCPQGAWAHVDPPIRPILGLPDDHALYCGLAIGHPDPDAAVNTLRTERAALSDMARFVGFSQEQAAPQQGV